MATLLFEILTEEIPVEEQPKIESHWRSVTPEILENLRISHGETIVHVTPRRSVLVVMDVADRQEDVTETVWGPPEEIAFRDGAPTKALEGFCRKAGVSPDKVSVGEKAGRRYVYVEKFHQGRPSVEVLGELGQALVAGVPFRKTMVWNSTRVRFSRPIRSVAFMLDDVVVPFTWAGVTSSSTVYAHRFMNDFVSHGRWRDLADLSGTQASVSMDDALSLGYEGGSTSWNLRHASHYTTVVQGLGGVVLSLDARRDAIRRALEEAAATHGVTVIDDEELLEETARLTELPFVVVGTFSEEFLEVPEEVLLTSMKKHQRYFAFRRADGSLAPMFAAVCGMVPMDVDVVRRGFERVLVARLSDARFFWDEDRRRPLTDNIEHMKTMVYHRRLGTLWEKIERMRSLAVQLAAVVGADSEKVDRAALLAKLDLETQMVYEFPELQGVMGMYYAREQGEDEEVARAIFEHYLPRQADDDVPSTPTGTAVALADRLDTLVAGIGAGLKPTGSSDAFGIRRAALTMLRILLDKGIHVSLSEWVAKAARLSPVDVDQGEVLEFVGERLRAMLSEGRPKEMVDAVMASGFDDPVDVLHRVRAIEEAMGTDTFSGLVRLFKRFNILKKVDSVPEDVDESLLKEPAEKELYRVLVEAEERVVPLVEARRYPEALSHLTSLWEPVDTFFDSERGVRVLADDPSLKANRAALLARLDRLFRRIADFKMMASLA